MKAVKLFLFFALFCLLGGCSGLKEATRGFAGVSTKVLEDARPEAIKKDFSGNLEEIHGKITEILKKEGSYVYKDDLTRNFIALYLSEEDTTPVGIFLTEVDNKIRIEVSSPSTYGKEFIANIVFSSLAGTRKAGVKKGNSDVKE